MLWSSRTFWQIPILAAGFVLLAVVGFGSVWLGQRAQTLSAQVAHTLEVRSAISDFLLQLRRAESAERGYVITADDVYRTDYREAAKALLPALDHLRILTADNPNQIRMIGELDPLLRKRLADFDDVVRLVGEKQNDQIRDIVAGGAGRQTMEQIRGMTTQMEAEEAQLLTVRTAASSRTSLMFAIAAIGGSLLVLLLATTAILSVRGSNRARDEAQEALQTANASLESRVAERTADLSEANDEIQRYAYIVSHDLRSPLVNIMGFTTELETVRKELFARLASLREQAGAAGEPDDALAQEFDEAIGFIKTSITKMDRLINAILKLSREGRREFHPETIDMSELLDSIAATVAHQATEAGATIEIGRLPSIYSDRLALEQIFSNLVDNAIKYLRADVPGKIRVAGHHRLSRVDYVVEDNGRGIDSNDHQRIFDLFRRSGTQDKPGEGIGLAHVRALVRRLGGTLSVRSELNKGSTFTVSLPTRWIVEERTAA